MRSSKAGLWPAGFGSTGKMAKLQRRALPAFVGRRPTPQSRRMTKLQGRALLAFAGAGFGYFPLQQGFRFCRNAPMPSWASPASAFMLITSLA